MEEKQKISSHGGYGKVLTASLFILTGLLLLARNTGIITDALFSLVVAWHSLLIIAGIYTIIHRRYLLGSALLLVGVYILVNRLLLFPYDGQTLFWPLVLVFIGFIVLRPRSQKHWEKKRMEFHARMAQRMASREIPSRKQAEQQCQSENGFLYSNNSLSAVRHVVLDKIFKGANIRTYFGGTTIDLRHTHIAPGETYIDLDCNWGGVELFIPSDWTVQIECNCFCGGCEDKRWRGAEPKQESCVLVIRGNVSFGGLEIKD